MAIWREVAQLSVDLETKVQWGSGENIDHEIKNSTRDYRLQSTSYIGELAILEKSNSELFTSNIVD